ncbi:MAG: HAD-IIIA family hydrolase [Patescibacteria group bacterium]|nr:HAD-IIIA family hydrolase [Patescibacteria group bacterium]
MSELKTKAVFFDRDGVILKTIIRNGKPTPAYSKKEFDEKGGFLPNVVEAIETVKKLGYLAILATNQPDIKYGNISQEDFDYVQSKVAKLPFDDIFICFHHPNENCDCRKPKPGMLLSASRKWNIDLSKSFFLGDTENDTEASKLAGCKSILMEASYNTDLEADYRIKNFTDNEGLITILTN